MKVEGSRAENMDNSQNSMEGLQGLSAEDTIKMMRARIDEQSNLIYTLKQKVDNESLRCQVLQKVNADLENQVVDSQKDLDCRRKKAELFEKKSMKLAASNEQLISSMDNYKYENAQLKLQYNHLQTENETRFSQKQQNEKESTQKLFEEIKLLTEKCTNQEKEYWENLAECKSKLQEQVAELQAKETSLIDQLCNSQKQQRDAEEMCKDLRLTLQKAERENALKEISQRENITSLTKEKDKLLHLSVENGKAIQEKQEIIQELERKFKEEEKARVEAENRFQMEVDAVNANEKVMSLQWALDDSKMEYKELAQDFDAYRNHIDQLLAQERELNKKLRQMQS